MDSSFDFTTLNTSKTDLATAQTPRELNTNCEHKFLMDFGENHAFTTSPTPIALSPAHSQKTSLMNINKSQNLHPPMQLGLNQKGLSRGLPKSSTKPKSTCPRIPALSQKTTSDQLFKTKLKPDHSSSALSSPRVIELDLLNLKIHSTMEAKQKLLPQPQKLIRPKDLRNKFKKKKEQLKQTKAQLELYEKEFKQIKSKFGEYQREITAKNGHIKKLEKKEKILVEQEKLNQNTNQYIQQLLTKSQQMESHIQYLENNASLNEQIISKQEAFISNQKNRSEFDKKLLNQKILEIESIKKDHLHNLKNKDQEITNLRMQISILEATIKTFKSLTKSKESDTYSSSIEKYSPSKQKRIKSKSHCNLWIPFILGFLFLIMGGIIFIKLGFFKDEILSFLNKPLL